MDKLRVLELGRYDFDDLKGGVQFYSESLAANTDASVEMDQLVSGQRAKTTIKEIGNRLKVTVATYGEILSVPISPGLLFWARRLCRQREYQIIHLNFPDPLGMLAAWLLPKKIPVVVTWHSDIVRQKMALKLFTPFLKIFMKRVKKILVATPLHLSSCPQLQALQMNEKIEVIEFGVNGRAFEISASIERRKSEIQQAYPGKFLLFTFGRHVYYKGYEYLIIAMAQTENCQLLLGGTGPLTAELKGLCQELHLEDRISFLGKISDLEIPAYLHACDVFCFASVDPSEAFGYAQLEAMMCGKPVITCALKNGVNYVNKKDETGLEVPARDPRALAQAICKLQENSSLRQKMGEQAFARAQSLFTIQRMVERTVLSFRKLMNS